MSLHFQVIRCHFMELPSGLARSLQVVRVCSTCSLCPGMHVGVGRHCVRECPVFHDIRHDRGFQHVFDDSHGAMHLHVWHPRQKAVALYLLQLLGMFDEALNGTCKHFMAFMVQCACVPSALLAAWTTSEVQFSLSLEEELPLSLSLACLHTV